MSSSQFSSQVSSGDSVPVSQAQLANVFAITQEQQLRMEAEAMSGKGDEMGSSRSSNGMVNAQAVMDMSGNMGMISTRQFILFVKSMFF